MRHTTAGGDGNRLGVAIAAIMLILGVAAFASKVGLSRTIYLIGHSIRSIIPF